MFVVSVLVGIETDRWTDEWIHRQTNRQTNEQTNRQGGGLTIVMHDVLTVLWQTDDRWAVKLCGHTDGQTGFTQMVRWRDK